MSLQEVRERWPSTGWGEREWAAVLRADEDLYHRILKGIGVAAANENHPRQVLSARELEVLTLLAHGKHQQEVGKALHLSAMTIKGMLPRIFEVLGARTTTHAVYLATSRSLLPPCTCGASSLAL